MPFRIGMEVYNWAEKKTESLPYPRLKKLASDSLKFCQQHPFAGIFCLLSGAMSLGPITFLVGFLVFANSCLLIGGLVFELLILATALSFFLPTFAFIIFISMVITSVLAVITYILLGGNTSNIIHSRSAKVKQGLATQTSEQRDSSGAPDLQHKDEDFVNKMTQTTEWVEKTSQDVEEIFNTTQELTDITQRTSVSTE